ncbi:hypothetical protein [Lysobacter sp. TAB13]|uniref:hypothetical protein n=1 Tax=Lysobacter sp. TAB13 TaxID=3233065 RepID=UPI003F985A3C
MTAVQELRSEAPTICLTCHEDYRYALQRIGQIEDAKANPAKALELAALKVAIIDYEARSASQTRGMPLGSDRARSLSGH